jgi:hypothetical protein
VSPCSERREHVARPAISDIDRARTIHTLTQRRFVELRVIGAGNLGIGCDGREASGV